MIGDKKSIYHSTLVDFGPAYVTVDSDIMPSKKGGGSYVVIEHEGTKQFLGLENDACVATMKNQKGKSFTIQATGSRNTASINILGADGAPKPYSAQPTSVEDAADKAEKFHEHVTRLLNFFYTVEENVTLEHRAAEKAGFPVTPESFGGKCSQAFRELYPYLDLMPATIVWKVE